MGVRKGDFYSVDPAELKALYTFVAQKHYPHRLLPKKWPNKELIGKAMARGWAVPCRYYLMTRGRGGFQRTFVYPGVSDAEMAAIHSVMRKGGRNG